MNSALLLFVAACAMCACAHDIYNHGYGYHPRYVQPVYRKVVVAEPEKAEPAKSYDMSYEVSDDEGNKNWRQETGDENNHKQGSYGYIDANGLSRQVKYIADDKGFRIVLDTNEPGVGSDNPADAEFNVKETPKKVMEEPKPIFRKSAYGHYNPYGYPSHGRYIIREIQPVMKIVEAPVEEVVEEVVEETVQAPEKPALGKGSAYVHQERKGERPFEYTSVW